MRAELLEQGGPPPWQRFMDELRHGHLGIGDELTTPTVREQLHIVYLAVMSG